MKHKFGRKDIIAILVYVGFGLLASYLYKAFQIDLLMLVTGAFFILIIIACFSEIF